MRESILIVEDEATLRTNIARFLGRQGYTVVTADTGKAALSELDRRAFDLVISDLRLPDIDGLGVLDHVRATSPETIVLIITAYASVDSAIEALRRGAHDYMLKPLSLADVLKKVEHIAEYHRMGQENARLRTLLRGESNALALLRRGGKTMNDLADMIEKVAHTNTNVIVVGESGAGKELVARAIHERSSRSDGPFVKLDMGAIPDTLVDSYLFGHERNAFTGAERREGVFRAASGGTLFLDEVGELPLAVQTKLLRAVETKEILPVGADEPIRVDTRIVAATHRDLAAMVAAGAFRQDLLFRLSVVELRVPSLRERATDIPELAHHFLMLHARTLRKSVHAIAPEAMSMLTRYHWPGNVRELSNVIERAVILASRETLTPADLPIEINGASPRPAVVAATASTAPSSQRQLRSELGEDGEPRPKSEPEAFALEEVGSDLEAATVVFQRLHLTRVLEQVGGNREAAAKLLGLSSATFYRYLQKLGLKGYQVQHDAPPSLASGAR